MSDEFGFESGFELAAFPGELLGEESSEQEDEYRRRGYSRSPSRYAGRFARRFPGRFTASRRLPPQPWPRPWPPRQRYRWPTIAWPTAPYPAAFPAPEPVDMGADVPPVEEPPPDAAPDPDQDADQDAGPEQEILSDVFGRVKSGIGDVVGRVTDVLGGGSRIIDLTAKADKSVRRTRDPKTVYALVLHQMACCFKPRDPLTRFLTLRAHFAILPDGRILQLHPVSANVPASNGFNACSVAVEFAGNFPNTRGRWWQGEKFGRNQPTNEQLEAGRYLIRHLTRTIGLTHVLAHRQSSGTRENDPGPEVWYHVGQWAIDNLKLKDGGPAFKIGTGNPIPQEWRTWGRRSAARETNPEREALQSETELAHDELETEFSGEASFGETEYGEMTEAEVAAAIKSAVATLPPAQRPQYRSMGRLAEAINKVQGSGLYLIMFNAAGKQKAYSGKAADLRRRLMQHRLCAQMLGLSADNHRVLVAPLPVPSLRPTEKAINTYVRDNYPQVFTNQRKELEVGLLGETWA